MASPRHKHRTVSYPQQLIPHINLSACVPEHTTVPRMRDRHTSSPNLLPAYKWYASPTQTRTAVQDFRVSSNNPLSLTAPNGVCRQMRTRATVHCIRPICMQRHTVVAEGAPRSYTNRHAHPCAGIATVTARQASSTPSHERLK